MDNSIEKLFKAATGELENTLKSMLAKMDEKSLVETRMFHLEQLEHIEAELTKRRGAARLDPSMN